MKKVTILFLLLSLSVGITVGCKQGRYQRYSASFFDTFDTYTTVVGYAKEEEEFDKYFEQIELRLRELHKLYDKYQSYEGINNIKTINDNAGIQPIQVEQEVIDLILFSKAWYKKTDGKVNIAMGSVLEIWHDYFTEASYDSSNVGVPSMEELKAASLLTDINKVIIDEENNTVFLAEKGMILNVGAIAKGFATEIVAGEIRDVGFLSGIISPGGNIHTIGKPLDGIRQRWGIGIQNPDKPVVNDVENTLDTVYVNDASVVSSGDYQRYYMHDGKRIHHIIDPDTLLPGEGFRAVTVIAEHAGVADFLSTSLFLMSYEEGLALIEKLDGIDAIWVLPDMTIRFSNGMKTMLRSQGASGSEN